MEILRVHEPNPEIRPCASLCDHYTPLRAPGGLLFSETPVSCVKPSKVNPKPNKPRQTAISTQKRTASKETSV